MTYPRSLVSALNAEVETDGTTTIATVSSFGPDEMLARFGLVAVSPEFLNGINGVGIARCRPEDHYDEVIGTYIAVSRANADFVRQVEDRVIASVITEKQHRLDNIGEAMAGAINDLTEVFNEALHEAGSTGRITAR